VAGAGQSDCLGRGGCIIGDVQSGGEIACRRGEKITSAVQDLPAARGLPQMLVWVNRAALVPVLPIAVTFSVPLPAFVMVSARALVVPSPLMGAQ
jgi:hypothetical protein